MSWDSESGFYPAISYRRAAGWCVRVELSAESPSDVASFPELPQDFVARGTRRCQAEAIGAKREPLRMGQQTAGAQQHEGAGQSPFE
ncbi:hypothetical protein K239x_53990 [Planctomycetes bacterium K23_9]|uniref:Uncharacterized protein n=1 Tax=Stieleria marina TaxID=1930275 RepID=A0A517P1Y3_9BACT|nr:hypothetical protein K239x_53990 [Planctomycetes bacterium K23_9]